MARVRITTMEQYSEEPLNKQHARELFCQYAFGEPKPPKELEDSVEEFLEICNGLPLALKVLGGHFVGNLDKDYWKRQLKRFSTTPDEELIRNLKVCYDALNDEEKEAILDIGCFLVGEETELAIRVLEGLYGSNIVHFLERLHQKCLVDFHYDVQSDDETECRKPEDPGASHLPMRGIRTSKEITSGKKRQKFLKSREESIPRQSYYWGVRSLK